MSNVQTAVRVIKDKARETKLELSENRIAWQVVDALNDGKGTLSNLVYYSNYMVTADYELDGKHYHLASNDPDTLYVSDGALKTQLDVIPAHITEAKDRKIELEL